MKMIAVAFIVLLVACCAFGVEVPPLPPSEFANTEVSTNFTFAVAEGSNRQLVFALELAATPTNNSVRLSSHRSLWETNAMAYAKMSVTGKDPVVAEAKAK